MRAGVIIFNRFGDLCQATPLIKSLYEQGYEVHLFIKPLLMFFAQNIPWIDSLWPIMDDASGVVEVLNDQGFDVLVNLTAVEEAASLAGRIKSKVKYGPFIDSGDSLVVNGEWATYFLCVPYDKKHNMFHISDLFLDMGGGKRPTSLPTILPYFPLDKQFPIEKGAVGLQLGASDEGRMWPIVNYIELASCLIDDGRQIVLLGDRSEEYLSHAFFDGLDNKYKDRVVDTVGSVPLHVLPRIIEALDVVVGPDTGTIHLAACMGKRVVSFFLGPAYYWATGPYGENNVVLQPDIECYPCEYHYKCTTGRCQKSITPDDVIESGFRIGAGENITCDVFVSYFDSYGYLRYVPAYVNRSRPITPATLVQFVAHHLWYFELAKEPVDSMDKMMKISRLLDSGPVPPDFEEIVDEYLYMLPLIADSMKEATTLIMEMHDNPEFLEIGYMELLKVNGQIANIERNAVTTCNTVRFIEISRKHMVEDDLFKIMEKYFFLYSLGEDMLRSIYSICIGIAREIVRRRNVISND